MRNKSNLFPPRVGPLGYKLQLPHSLLGDQIFHFKAIGFSGSYFPCVWIFGEDKHTRGSLSETKDQILDKLGLVDGKRRRLSIKNC